LAAQLLSATHHLLTQGPGPVTLRRLELLSWSLSPASRLRASSWGVALSSRDRLADACSLLPTQQAHATLCGHNCAHLHSLQPPLVMLKKPAIDQDDNSRTSCTAALSCAHLAVGPRVRHDVHGVAPAGGPSGTGPPHPPSAHSPSPSPSRAAAALLLEASTLMYLPHVVQEAHRGTTVTPPGPAAPAKVRNTGQWA
jgi:hypothetical protein